MSKVAEANKMITITLPDGVQKEYPAGVTAGEVAADISKGLAKKVLAARVNGEVVEPQRPIHQDAELTLLTWEDPDGKRAFWHSSAHILAEALEAYYPGIKLGIGPPIEDGFYYDVDFGDYAFSEEDFEKIEGLFLKLAKSGETFVRREVSKDDALAHYRQKNDPYKLELIQELEDGQITFYESGNFVDLCKGPHINDSRHIKAVKLLTTAGAYWRGDSSRPQLTRIYGISFPKQQELKDYLHRLEEAKKRDHRRLGKQLGLFSFHEEGPGFPFWHPNGMTVFNGLAGWLRRKLVAEYGYQEIKTPIILNEDLWHRSGHWGNYNENMYFTAIDDEHFAVKPMNCPGSTLVFGSEQRSYRDLPLRLFEFGLVHRHELSGVLHGLFRVRAFTQDDAHVFCTPDQIEDEILTLIQLIFEVYATFGFEDVDVYLATRPDKYMGELAVWENAEAALSAALERSAIDYQLNPGDGAFYGPKIDFVVRDSLKREWQLGTIQLDFSMPERFELAYKGPDSQPHRPVMIHRAILGSFERFIGILLEHTAGELPLWLAPVQARILPISDRFLEYAEELQHHLTTGGFRTEIDRRDERISRKIRDAEINKVPLMIVVGEKEAEAGTAALRARGEGDLGSLSRTELTAWLAEALRQSYQPGSSLPALKATAG